MNRGTIVVGSFFSILLLTLMPKAEANEIFGCYHKEEGHLRIVADHELCRPSELPIILAGVAGPKTTSYCGQLEFSIFDEEEGGEVVFHFVDTGGPFFIVHGVHDPDPMPEDPDDKPVIWSGTCYVCEDCIQDQVNPILFCNLHMTQEHAEKEAMIKDQLALSTWFDGRLWQLSLDLKTKLGQVWNVGIDFQKVTRFDGELFDPDESYFSPDYGNFSVTVIGDLPGCLRRYVE